MAIWHIAGHAWHIAGCRPRAGCPTRAGCPQSFWSPQNLDSGWGKGTKRHPCFCGLNPQSFSMQGVVSLVDCGRVAQSSRVSFGLSSLGMGIQAPKTAQTHPNPPKPSQTHPFPLRGFGILAGQAYLQGRHGILQGKHGILQGTTRQLLHRSTTPVLDMPPFGTTLTSTGNASSRVMAGTCFKVVQHECWNCLL